MKFQFKPLHKHDLSKYPDDMKLTTFTRWIVILFYFFISNSGGSKLNFDPKTLLNVKRVYGEAASQRVVALQRLINDNANASIEDKLYHVNRFFNQIQFKDDMKHWSKKDYWATPYEFLGTNAGDCEDFVIAKYFTLIEIGVPSELLRLMYVTATRPTRQAHMVLAYYPSPTDIPLVLDNINKRILPASKRRDLIPVYSFNGDGLWLAKNQGQGRQMKKLNNNRLWTELHSRMNEASTNER